MKKILAGAAVAAFILSGCSMGNDDPAPTVTVTASPSASSTPESLGLQALETVWDDMALGQQIKTCNAFRFSPEFFYANFQKGAGEYANVVTEEEVTSFFNDKCGDA